MRRTEVDEFGPDSRLIRRWVIVEGPDVALSGRGAEPGLCPSPPQSPVLGAEDGTANADILDTVASGRPSWRSRRKKKIAPKGAWTPDPLDALVKSWLPDGLQIIDCTQCGESLLWYITQQQYVGHSEGCPQGPAPSPVDDRFALNVAECADPSPFGGYSCTRPAAHDGNHVSPNGSNVTVGFVAWLDGEQWVPGHPESKRAVSVAFECGAGVDRKWQRAVRNGSDSQPRTDLNAAPSPVGDPLSWFQETRNSLTRYDGDGAEVGAGRNTNVTSLAEYRARP